MSQRDLWVRVLTINRELREAIGEDLSDLSPEFRSSHAYQSYAAMCGETLYAFQDGELDDAMVDMLEECAGKVIALYREG